MTLRIGLTGGIASGKSTVAAHFAALGIAVIDADEVGRELLQPGSALLEQIFERFAPGILQLYGLPLRRPDGSLDRRLLRGLVFEEPAERAALEALLHPAIQARMEALAAAATSPYQVHVVPLLVEGHSESRYDRVLVVDCPPALQLERLVKRDGTDAQQAQAMLDAQVSRARRLASADDVILNDADPEALVPQVSALDRKYRTLANAVSPPLPR